MRSTRGRVRGWSVERAVVQSRAQLTYAELLHHEATAAAHRAPWTETLALVAAIGPRRLAREAERGGVSLPVREQHVQRRPRVAHAPAPGSRRATRTAWCTRRRARRGVERAAVAAHRAPGRVRHARGGVGLLRTMPPFADGDVAKFRRIARTLGRLARGDEYAAFMQRCVPRRRGSTCWCARRGA
jgi:exoribonuclease R